VTVIQIQWAAEDMEEAQRIVGLLLKQKLIACATLIDAVESHYVWEGQQVCSEEVKVVAKTLDTHFTDVANLISEESNYDVPEVLAFETFAVSDSYFKWVKQQVGGKL
jgi:periplasmic divalent cation tolerance protein